MDQKQILIKILTKFQDAGIKAATQSLSRLDKAVKSSRNVFNGFKNIGSSVTNSLNPLRLFHNLFGRITGAMLIWVAWRKIADGFRAMADAIVGGNARMQSALNTFTALAKGSEELGKRYVDTIRVMSSETGARVDELLQNARRLPTQVGQNFKAFEQLTKTSLVLGAIDPIQGVSGAMIALTNAMEGTAQGFRSLIRRFEIGTFEQVKRIIEETANPLEAINQLMEESGINIDALIQAQLNTLHGSFSALINISREFVRILGEPFINSFTEDLIGLREWVQENQTAIFGLAKAIGNNLLAAFQTFKKFLLDTFFGGEIGEITLMDVFNAVGDSLLALADKISGFVVFVLNSFTSLAKAIASLFGGEITENVQQQTTQAVGAITKTTGLAAKAVKEAGKGAKDALSEAIPAAAEVAKHSVGEVISTLTNLGNKGKETTKRLIKGLLEGMGEADIKQVAEGVIDNIINLESQEIAQKQSVKKLKEWVDQAEREVKAARNKLKLFDLATADIPERFTRARRRQIELEIMRAEKERDRRKEGLEIAKEQLAVTKENLRAQRQVLSAVQAALREAEKSGGEGIFKGFTPGDIDTDEFNRQIEEAAALFDAPVKRVFAGLRANFDEVAAAFAPLATAIGDIVTGIMSIDLSSIGGIFESITGWWSSIPADLRNFLLALAGVLLFPKAGIPLLITAAIVNPSLGTAGLAALVAGAKLGPGGALVATLAVSIGAIFKTFQEEDTTAGALFELLLNQPVDLVINLIGKIGEGLQRFLDFMGVDLNIEAEFEQVTKEMKATIQDAKAEIEGGNLAGVLARSIEGNLSLVQSAAQGVFNEPLVTAAQNAYDTLVGNSIFPDMMDQIVMLFTDLSVRLQSPLEQLTTSILGGLATLREGWVMEWSIMADSVREVLELRKQAESRTLAQSAGKARTQTSRTLNNAISQRRQQQRIQLNLDANETQKLMERGIYNGILNVVR